MDRERQDSDKSTVLAGNIHAHVSTRSKKPLNKLRRRVSKNSPDWPGLTEDAPAADSDCSSVFQVQERGISNCKHWQRMESTHLQHAPQGEQVLTEEEEDEDSYLTEDNTMYGTAVEQEQDVTKESGSTFVTAKDKLSSNNDTCSDRTPPFSASSSTLLRTGMSAQLLFSVGKRKSILTKHVNSRPILAEDSDQEDDMTGNDPSQLSSWTRSARAPAKERRKSETPRRAPRRSILGRNEVVLLTSESDDDGDSEDDFYDEQREAENRDKRVGEWIHASPQSVPPGKDLNDYRAETFEVTDDLDLSSAHSERTSKCTEQIRTLTLAEVSSEDDGLSDPLLPLETSSNCWRPGTKTVGVGHDFSEYFTDDLDADDGHSTKDGSNNLTSEYTSRLDMSATARSDVSSVCQEGDGKARHRSLQVSLASEDTSIQRSPDRCGSDHDTSVVIEHVSPQGSAPRGGAEVRRRRSSSSSDDNLQEYLQQLRKKREAIMAGDASKREARCKPMNDFIVDDDDDDGEEEEESQDSRSDCFDLSADEGDDGDEKSDGSDYSAESDDDRDSCSSGDNSNGEEDIPVIELGDTTDTEEEEEEEEELPDIPSPPRKDKEKTKPISRNLVTKPVRAPFTPLSANAVAQSASKLSFLQSLSLVQADDRCHPLAVKYITRFQANKVDLAAKLFRLFNEEVFLNSLDPNTEIIWSARMLTTAGLCYNKSKGVGQSKVRFSSIKLASKVLDSADRLRDTLIHEMCHAATWVVSACANGHGPLWKDWAARSRRRFPDLPVIGRCHSYVIRTKYTYRCMQCGQCVNRHSKSLDVEKYRCGKCKGAFELLLNRVAGVTSATPGRRLKQTPVEQNTPLKTPNRFAAFVKENYKTVRTPGVAHADAMKELSRKFALAKLAEEDGDDKEN